MDPILFCNVAWMRNYRGIRGDAPRGGGSYIAEHGTGSEIHNFNALNGVMHGFVQVRGTINLQRLGATEGAEEVNDVTVVWIAPSPLGNVIVGCYYHATVLKNLKHFSGREYNILAESKYCHLFPVDMRTFQIPRGSGGMGQSNVWYADNKSPNFIRIVLSYLHSGGKSAKKITRVHRKSSSFNRNTDPLKRQKIEERAIREVTKYFLSLGYTIKSFEKDNLGWDLQAYLESDKFLRLEVKGLSGGAIVIELTPNEFSNMQKYSSSYRICVVTNTLQKPKVAVFSYSPDHHKWEDKDGQVLRIKKIVGARIETE